MAGGSSEVFEVVGGQISEGTELWSRLVELAQAFDFDYVELSLSLSPKPDSSSQPDLCGGVCYLQQYWPEGTQETYAKHPERFWKIEIPFGGDSGKHSYAVFARALDKEQLHLRIESLVSEVSSNIAKGIAKVQSGEN